MNLNDIAYYVKDKVPSTQITLEQYITTDNLLPQKGGRVCAVSLPPNKCSLTHYQKGDVLVANIRPYLQKIWYADIEGGASPDVLVFRAKEGHNSQYVYTCLLQDAFFNFVMKAPIGAKMPRGEKNHILRFPIVPINNEEEVGEMISNIDRKIALNRAMNEELEQTARDLYDYWFLQFDFPDANGKPYRSSGGKMVYNDTLKREIPVGWEVENIFSAVNVLYGYPFATEYFVENETPVPVVRIRDILEGKTSAYSTEVVDSKYLLQEGDVLIGMDGNFHMNFWHTHTDYLNQRCLRLRPYSGSSLSSLQVFFDTKPIIKAREKSIKGSTVAHLSDKDIKSIYLVVPKETETFQPRKHFDAIMQQIISNRNEIYKLLSLRDELLPLLMNGQVKVKE